MDETVVWAESQQIDHLVDAIGRSCDQPMIAIGSGGSLTCAAYACLLHRRYTGQLAQPSTPWTARTAISSATSVFIFTASGRNPDVRGSLKEALENEPASITVLSCARKSPLSALASGYEYVEHVGFEIPTGKDGFVATNSMLAQVVLLRRAYAAVFNDTGRIKARDILATDRVKSEAEQLETEFRTIGPTPHYIVLHGEAGLPPAIDLESKFSEVGLGSVQLTDFRNFAHGRHNWLDKNPETTTILSLEGADDRLVADRMLRIVPHQFPRIRIPLEGSPIDSAIVGLLLGFRLTAAAGAARGIDPGRPGIPEYGSKLYKLNAWANPNKNASRIENTAIARKSRRSMEQLALSGEIDYWRGAYRAFVDQLLSASFTSLVMDYDGTLCDRRERFKGPRAGVADLLNTLLASGVHLGIVTGRGKSVGSDLRKCLHKSNWTRVYIGYYSGSDIGRLDDQSHPDGSECPTGELADLFRFLRANAQLSNVASIQARKYQLTVEPRVGFPQRYLLSLIQQLILATKPPRPSVFVSDHSVDILAPGASKTALLWSHPFISGNNLCIGDMGEWPGNDSELLAQAHSLSVHHTSPDIRTCWNLAPPGYRNVQGSLHYLSALSATTNGLAFSASTLNIWDGL